MQTRANSCIMYAIKGGNVSSVRDVIRPMCYFISPQETMFRKTRPPAQTVCSMLCGRKFGNIFLFLLGNALILQPRLHGSSSGA
jgi:hypothetical protein